MTLRFPYRASLAAGFACALATNVVFAASSAANDEIDHLLQYVAASHCTFVRNGSEYASDKAREHLVDKYRFAGSRIATAEQFIDYLATKSSLSGQPYHVRCGRQDELSAAWLGAELKRYRSEPRAVR
ncbi:MAG TPA: DUF5329 domain-containing protein [Casimicrobiaceae bacterium]|jgi:hypothetical protein|nr:DUF5329 domain-containing protein [Casimicrobiaceae bacterium]HET9748271.1 DUF5329 domain-containing protein [Casimicrobiaceae bacterium]HWD15517.1 DUF5329 domain-containing protein [Casimicrobiaceae bacterium]HWD35023.1 DUF5329 domain-containing protein [Casimicrobiaceae bacterium]